MYVWSVSPLTEGLVKMYDESPTLFSVGANLEYLTTKRRSAGPARHAKMGEVKEDQMGISRLKVGRLAISRLGGIAPPGESVGRSPGRLLRLRRYVFLCRLVLRSPIFCLESATLRYPLSYDSFGGAGRPREGRE